MTFCPQMDTLTVLIGSEEGSLLALDIMNTLYKSLISFQPLRSFLLKAVESPCENKEGAAGNRCCFFLSFRALEGQSFTAAFARHTGDWMQLRKKGSFLRNVPDCDPPSRG